MSSFEDNYDAIVKNNKNEVLGIFNQLHALGPAFQAFHQLTKSHKIKPLRKRKGQYNPNKRHLSAYNIFTQEVQNDVQLKDKPFEQRSKLIGDMWKKVKANKKEHQKYIDKANVKKEEVQPAQEDAPVQEAGADVKPAKPTKKARKPKEAKEAKPKEAKEAKAKEAKPKGPKKAGKRGKKKPAEEKVVGDPSEVSEEDLYMEDSDDEVFNDSDAEVSD